MMTEPSFIPADKFDLAACEILQTRSDAEIESHLGELVSWLADGNWPVSTPIIRRLSMTGEILAPYLNSILKSHDDCAKYFLLAGLMLTCRPEVRALCLPEIERISKMPTSGEQAEGVDEAAQDVLNSAF